MLARGARDLGRAPREVLRRNAYVSVCQLQSLAECQTIRIVKPVGLRHAHFLGAVYLEGGVGGRQPGALYICPLLRVILFIVNFPH